MDDTVQGGVTGHKPEGASRPSTRRSWSSSFGHPGRASEVARDLGINKGSLHEWLKQADVDAGRREGLSTAEREELVKARREIRVLREERDILRKAAASSHRRFIFHIDRGCQYTSMAFGTAVKQSGLLQSVGRPATGWDNIVAERFFATLKKELIYRRTWPRRGDAQLAVFEYIEVFYSRRRLHSTLGYLSPTAPPGPTGSWILLSSISPSASLRTAPRRTAAPTRGLGRC